MKYLYTNGCSFVYGDELSNPNDNEWLEKKRWSRIFSEKYNVIEINESENGSSNYRIYRTTNGMDASGHILPNQSHGPFWGKSPSITFWKNYVKYYFDDKYFNEESALRVFAMQELLEKLNVKYYFYFSMENNVVHYIQRKYKDLYNFDKIYHQSQEDWIKDEVKRKTGGIIEWDNKINTYVNPKGGWSGFNGSHPDEKSHSLWADFLYGEYKRLYK